MILVVGSTGEGRQLIRSLRQAGYQIVTWTDSAYGEQLARQDGATLILTCPLTEGNLATLGGSRQLEAVIDATLPYPNQLSRTLEAWCQQQQLYYLRFLRPETLLPDDSLIYQVATWEEAARTAARLGETIFLTTGTNNLEVFVKNPLLKDKRIVVRVLPEHQVIKKCQDLGLTPRDIIAMQGPFSKEMNKAMFKAYKAGVIITRDAGPAGGTEAKIAAALALKIPVVIIKRPAIQYRYPVYSVAEVIDLLKKIAPVKSEEQG
ncbi:precorrin-6A reductase [Moorella mulderi DSM 14980]|uniref:Precorrin-6A reductase n=1 Tax=Moorella mulderi DSM 14980 TaxID=1122241 RepID=A0A151B044_9FIRM|nr:precorrin-6A reductase [Moorella mulderi DSM 14980]